MTHQPRTYFNTNPFDQMQGILLELQRTPPEEWAEETDPKRREDLESAFLLEEDDDELAAEEEEDELALENEEGDEDEDEDEELESWQKKEQVEQEEQIEQEEDLEKQRDYLLKEVKARYRAHEKEKQPTEDKEEFIYKYDNPLYSAGMDVDKGTISDLHITLFLSHVLNIAAERVATRESRELLLHFTVCNVENIPRLYAITYHPGEIAGDFLQAMNKEVSQIQMQLTQSVIRHKRRGITGFEFDYDHPELRKVIMALEQFIGENTEEAEHIVCAPHVKGAKTNGKELSLEEQIEMLQYLVDNFDRVIDSGTLPIPETRVRFTTKEQRQFLGELLPGLHHGIPSGRG